MQGNLWVQVMFVLICVSLYGWQSASWVLLVGCIAFIAGVVFMQLLQFLHLVEVLWPCTHGSHEYLANPAYVFSLESKFKLFWWQTRWNTWLRLIIAFVCNQSIHLALSCEHMEKVSTGLAQLEEIDRDRPTLADLLEAKTEDSLEKSLGSLWKSLEWFLVSLERVWK